MDELSRLLEIASGPAPDLHRFLHTALETSVRLGNCDVGGAVAIWTTSSRSQSLVGCAVQGNVNRVIWEESLKRALTDTSPDSPSSLQAELDRKRPDSSVFGGYESHLIKLVDDGTQVGLMQLESSIPVRHDETQFGALRAISGVVALGAQRLVLRERLVQFRPDMDMIGTSPSFLDLERQIRRAARLDAPILICGERGSGKELAALAIHCLSARYGRQFMPVLVPNLSEGLAIDELFGHTQHAFTGAARRREGKFKTANGGTIFLDEVGALRPSLQAALLRVTETGEVHQIGRDNPLWVDVRVISATNRSLTELIGSGQFRADLYDRLTALEIDIPPLRTRRDDISLLTNFYIRRYCRQFPAPSTETLRSLCEDCEGNTVVPCATTRFVEALRAYEWPGNIRELKHIIYQAMARSMGDPLDTVHLPKRLLRGLRTPDTQETKVPLNARIKAHIEEVLATTNYNQTRAAKALEIPLSTLRNKMLKLGIQVNKRNLC